MGKDATELLDAASKRLSGRRAAVRRVIAQTPSDKRAQTQAALLLAGRGLIAEKGIGAMSVGDLCARAGFSRGAFYSNFTDTDHFVRRLAQEQWAEMTAFAHAAVEEALPGGVAPSVPESDAAVSTALSSLADGLLQAMPVSREFYLLQEEFAAYVIRDEAHAPTLRAAYDEFRASLCSLLVDGLAAIGRECLLSPEDTTDVIFAVAERSMRSALMNGEGEGALTDLLDRAVPELLARLSVPVR